VRRDKCAARGGFDHLVYLQATRSTFVGEEAPLEVPPLFGSDAVGGRAPAPQHTSLVVIKESSARRIVLKVPVIAPLRDGIPLREYGLVVGQGTVTFRHCGADLEITIEETEPAQGPGQLSLAIDPT
jgi:hypothetical protein